MNTPLDPSKCPLCAGPNDCQLCSATPHKGPCWCVKTDFPPALLTQVPPDSKNKACVCRNCVAEFHRQKPPRDAPKPGPGDFYFEDGLLVFTAQYHLRRGYCCQSACRHCPYSHQSASPNESRPPSNAR